MRSVMCVVAVLAMRGVAYSGQCIQYMVDDCARASNDDASLARCIDKNLGLKHRKPTFLEVCISHAALGLPGGWKEAVAACIDAEYGV